MKELTQKVVILNNFSSPFVSQAIIVLKDYNPKLEGRAIEDAEKIVSEYIERMQKGGHCAKSVRPKGKMVKIVIGLCLIIAAFAAIKYL
jgi:hypothetical protein